MLTMRPTRCLFIALAATALGCAPPPSEISETSRLLAHGWKIRAAAEVEAAGDRISQADYDTAEWTPAGVPTTVLAALVEQGVYEDPYFGMNLEKIPAERFSGPWWYRTTFDLEAVPPSVRLAFDGVNYSAAVWVNGRRVAARDEVRGAFRRFEIDVTGAVRAGVNALAVEVHPPAPGDFTVGFVDWNPTAPDKNMGLWREVRLRLTGAVSVEDVFVESDVDLETLAHADLTVNARLRNHGDRPATARLAGEIEGRRFERSFELGAGESRQVAFSPEEHPALSFDQPRLWWPHDLGEPHLYELELTADAGGEPSDRRRVRFGIREVDDYFNAQGHRGYKVNGREVLVRGGGWVDDLMLDEDPERLEAQFRYARHLNLNTLRLEGFWGSSERLYDLADEMGLMLMPGWSCQWEWEEYLGKEVDDFGGVKSPEDIDIVARSLADQVMWLRNHPSIFVWVLGSDKLPRPDLERRYAEVMAKADTTRPLLASCGTLESDVTGPTGVKMNGPYDWVPPVYWYVDKTRGGAYGFNTETGPGPQPPPVSSLRRMLGDDHLWPIDEVWEYHCGRHQFGTLDRYKKALDERYGPSADVHEFVRKSQLASYEAMRAMFEAFAVRRPETTGLILWMFNSAWPEMFWQLYDYYLMPNGAFYGTLAATAPAGLVYDYGDDGVWAVARPGLDVGGWVARVRVLDLASRELLAREVTLPEDLEYSARLVDVGEARRSVPVSFLDLRLERPDGTLAARNFYWLSAAEDELDEAASTWFYTPASAFADFKPLAGLAPAALEVSAAASAEDGEGRLAVELTNPGETLAFFVELTVVDRAGGRPILPVFFDDNYVSVLPGEARRLEVRFPLDGVALGDVGLDFSGWNVEAGEAPVSGGG